MLRLARISRFTGIASRGLRLTTPRTLVAARTFTASTPFLQKKEPVRTKDKDGKPESILTDDLLFQAGMDIEQPTSKDTASAAAEGSSIKEGELLSDTDSAGTKRPRKRKQTSSDKKMEKAANWMYIFTFASLAGTALYMMRDWDPDEPAEMREKVSNGYEPGLMFERFKLRLRSIFTYFQEPPFPDLLPPPPPPPYQRPLTLVLTLDDLLVHSEWSQKHGWRTAKRPGVDYFLGYLSQYYEIVIFSSNYMMYSERVCEKLDPLHAFVSYNLFKEHCLYKKGKHIKDLSKLNRDTGKVIIIDVDPDSYSLQPENAIPMKPWDGTPDDKLIRLIPFLEYLATQTPTDVKPILSSFEDRNNIPDEFNERMEKLREKFYADENKRIKGNWALRLLGISGTQGAVKAKFPLDLIREEGEKNYVQFLKMIEEEKEKMKIQQEQMASQTFTLKDYVEGNIPSPEEQMQAQLQKQKEIDQLFEQRKKEKEAQASK